MTEIHDFEIVDIAAEDAVEDAMCKEICAKADHIDGLIDQFLDHSPEKALAFVMALESAASAFVAEDLARQFEGSVSI